MSDLPAIKAAIDATKADIARLEETRKALVRKYVDTARAEREADR